MATMLWQRLWNGCHCGGNESSGRLHVYASNDVVWKTTPAPVPQKTARMNEQTAATADHRRKEVA